MGSSLHFLLSVFFSKMLAVPHTHQLKKRNTQSAYAFMKRLVQTFGEPTVLTTDKALSLLCSLKKLKVNDFYKSTTHSTIKHFNNYIEQDHRHVKRRFARSSGF